jgi:hypothetical protein
VEDDALVAGVASHHRTDAAFHDHPWFKSTMAALVEAMPVADRGVRAAAHVAVELAIDGALLQRGVPDYDAALAWATSSLAGPWREVAARLRDGEIVRAFSSSWGIADRAVSVMERRPRLRPIAPDRVALADAVAAVIPVVQRDLDELMAALTTPS